MTDTEIIDKLGGTGVVAAICRLDKSTVSGWRMRGIPRVWRMWLRQNHPKGFKGRPRAREILGKEVKK